MKNKKAFTLIELLAVILILAILALISVPIVTGYIDKTKEDTFNVSVNSLINAYRYKVIDEGIELGRVTACTLDVEKCNIQGYIDKCNLDSSKICVYLTNGNKCAMGDSESFQIKDGNCSNDNPDDPNSNIPPVITNITVTGLTVSTATVVVTFNENNLVMSHRYRLLDENNNVIKNWSMGDSINNITSEKTSKKEYTGLMRNKKYKVEVEITNNNSTNNKATSSKEFTTLNFEAPVITYDMSKWETEKDVVITYPDLANLTRKYRTKTNTGFNFDLMDASQVQHVTVNRYQYIVQAIVKGGGSTLSTNKMINYIDNELDENNTKPTVTMLDYKNANYVNTNEVSINLKDTKSGVAYYCVSTINDPSNCNEIGNNTELNKWVLAVNQNDLAIVGKEVRNKTLQHQLVDSGTYYAFVKDAVGNISSSDSKTNPSQFVTYKIDYDLNGGSGNVPYQIKLKDESLTLTDIVPVRDGYVFLGWDTNKDAHTDNPRYLKQGTYTRNENIKLYAQWRKEITIIYDSNGGTGTPDYSVCYRYNAEATCPIKFKSNPFTRQGYTFMAWALDHNGATTYNVNGTYDIAESRTVYAGWKINTLTFNNQTIETIFDTANQTVTFSQPSNGNGNYTYSELEEKLGNTPVSYMTISSDRLITVTGSTPVNTYTYKVRATSPVSNNIDSLTSIYIDAVMTVKINPYNITQTSSNNSVGLSIADTANQTYKNGYITPEPIINAKTSNSAGFVRLYNGTDFTYSYSNNYNIGVATITVTGKGNYTGQNSKNFTIVPYNLSNVTIADMGAETYRSAAIQPTPGVVAYSINQTLVNNTDFTYSYSNNVNAGTGTVTITGRGNFTGTNSKNFTINSYNLSGAYIADMGAVTYTGAPHYPTPAVTALGRTLAVNSEYTYSYSRNTNATAVDGNGIVTITGVGNFTGTNSKEFTINSAVGDQTVVGATLTYNGYNQGLITTLSVSNREQIYCVYKDGVLIQDWTNYNIYGGPVASEAGTYTIYWQGYQDNYEWFQKPTEARINPLPIAVPAGANPQSKVYNGSWQASGVSCPGGSYESGNTSAINVGTYHHYCTLNNGNYIWNDWTSGTKDYVWYIHNADLVGSVIITGENKARQTLSASVYNPYGAGLSYQWYANDVPISGATGASYTLTSNEIGKIVKVIITASMANFNTATWVDDTDVANNGQVATKASVKAVKQVCSESLNWVSGSDTTSSCPTLGNYNNLSCWNSSDEWNRYYTSCSEEGTGPEIVTYTEHWERSCPSDSGSDNLQCDSNHYGNSVVVKNSCQFERYRYEFRSSESDYQWSATKPKDKSEDVPCDSSHVGVVVYAGWDYRPNPGPDEEYYLIHYDKCVEFPVYSYEKKYCREATRYRQYYESCRPTYSYLYDWVNYPDSYPDTCIPSTPSCNSSSDIGNVMVSCVEE